MRRDIPIRPEPSSKLGQLLADLEAVEADAHLAELHGAMLRAEHEAALLAHRRAAYSGSAYRRSEEELTALKERIDVARQRWDAHTNASSKPLLAKAADLDVEFTRRYAQFLELKRKANELLQLEA